MFVLKRHLGGAERDGVGGWLGGSGGVQGSLWAAAPRQPSQNPCQARCPVSSMPTPVFPPGPLRGGRVSEAARCLTPPPPRQAGRRL